MEYFARLDENNIVTAVITVSEQDLQNLPFPESEEVGIAFLNTVIPNAVWKQTSDIHSFRFHFAGIGYKFHPECGAHGGFAPPKPFENFVWDEATCTWIPPIPHPTDGLDYYWSEYMNKWCPVLVSPPDTTIIG